MWQYDFDRLRIAHVARIRVGQPTDRGRPCLQRVTSTCHERNPDTVACELLGDRRTDSHRCPGDDGDLSFECPHHNSGVVVDSDHRRGRMGLAGENVAGLDVGLRQSEVLFHLD